MSTDDSRLPARVTGHRDGRVPAGTDPSFLGSGFAWPLGVDHTGSIRLSDPVADLDRSIELVLMTAPGERLMRPQFGCRIWDLLFEPVTANLLGQIAVADPRLVALSLGSEDFCADVGMEPSEDTLMLPKRESFTGAKNTQEFVQNFSRQIPFCLSYEDRNGAKPYAMLFKNPGGAKKGPLILYGAKPGTLFCDRDGPQVVAEGEWEERTVGGTKAMVLSFAANVDPLDTGVTHVERESARIAFIEPTKGTMGVRPPSRACATDL